MTEREIFQAALELGDPAARAAYVAKACGDNAALRAEVEELLRTHDETSQFLETPAAATNAVVEKTVIGNSSIEDDDSDGPPSDLTEFSRYLAPATRPGWIGRLGHYEIEQILGRGAFGIVAKAFDDKLHRVVAIKFMNPTLAATSPPRKRFLREARTAAAVTHENIVAIYAVEEEPIPYLVMEYIPGQTLQQRMDANGPFDVPETLKLGRQIASGLAAAHAANLIHRDIKPANILLTGGTNERAKISDFGLARAVDDASLTSSGLIAGTPMYMSPEQARGETLDHRTDLFSLGSVLYQMASGRPPFRAANTIAVLKRVCEDRPRPLDDVMPGAPEWLQTIIFRLMEKDRDNRYQSAGEVAELLERCESELRVKGVVAAGHDFAWASRQPKTANVSPLATSNDTSRGEHEHSKRRSRAGMIGGLVLLATLCVGMLSVAPRLTDWFESPIPQLPETEVTGGLRFDGRDDHVELTDLDWDYPQFTLDAIVTSSDRSDMGTIAYMGGDNKDTVEWMALYDGPQADPGKRISGASIQGKTPYENAYGPFSAGRPQHRALTFDGRYLNYYINGIWQGQRFAEPHEGLQWNINSLLIGCDGDRRRFFEGVIHQLRVSRVNRYSGKFAPVASLSSDAKTLALFRFDEGAGDLLHDSSGNGHDARIVGATWVNPSKLAPTLAGWHGWPTDAPKPAIAPFNAEQCRQHQAEWAEYLGVPVEYENSVGMKFRLIPPGEFLMGSTPEEIEAALPIAGDDGTWQDCIRSEGPLHKVILTQPFYLATNEVTQSQFQQIMEVNPSRFAASGEWADSVTSLDTASFPVESVDWGSARQFCQRLAKREGLQATASTVKGMQSPFGTEPYRLPAEAEWEFACRAGTTSQFFSGDSSADLSKVGWFDDKSSERTHATGELAANAFGLHDMHGNVWEWVLDSWRTDRYAARSGKPAVDPFDPMTKDSEPLTRGGNWSSYAEACRSASRSSASSAYNSTLIGFRVAMSVSAVQDQVAKQRLDLTKPAITPSSSEPAAAPEAVLAEYYAVNRRAAEKALALGGSVLLERLPGHELIGLGGGDALPDGPFLVRIWSVFNSSTVTNADLQVLRGLRHIREIAASPAFNRLDAAAIPHIAAVRAPLQFLSFHHPIKTSDLAALPTLKQLISLWVLGHDVDDDWECLEKFPHLRSLNINEGPVPSLASLSKYPQLRSLALMVNEEPDLAVLPELQRLNPRLRVTVQVGAKHRIVGNDPLRAAVPDLLAAGLPLLAVSFDGTANALSKENVDKTFDEGVMYVKLEAIPADVRLSDSVRAQLTFVVMLQLDAAGHREADLLSAVLANRHDIQTLSLQNSDLTDTGLKKLEPLIGLQYLDISGTNVTEEGVKAFRTAVPGCILRTSTGTLEPDYVADPAYPGRPQDVSRSADWNDWPADAPPSAIAPFDADQAKKHQEDWAAYLKVPVEYTNSIGMKFRLIPPGEFLMGGTPEEIAAALEADLTPFNGDFNWWSACLRSEGPRHRVRLTRSFYLGTHEVTQQQYQEIIGENPSENSPTGSNRERVAGLDTANFPVEFLSWHDAVQFCNRLNEREQRTNRHLATMPPTLSDTGTGYRLPTEAEWEFACRAGTTSRYWTGHEVVSVLKAGWFQVNDGGRTHAVGELLANPFGLFDVHGNAWEWTADGWDESWYQQFPDTVAVNPVCPLTDQPVAMMKTGTWPAFEHFCRAASRIPWPCDARNSLQGMRVSLPVEAVQESLKVSGSFSTASETLAEYYARNRRAAERALAVDGNSSEVLVEIPQPFEWRRITTGQRLPDEPFVIRQWSVKNATKVSNDDLDVLAGLHHVLNLNVMAKNGLDAGCVPSIGAVRSSLKELAIGHITLKTSDLSKLPEMPHVHFLWISAEQVNDEWRFLTKFPAIRAISLYGSPIPDLLPLREAKHLRRLLITTWGTAPDLTQIHELQSGNPNLRVFLDMDQQHTTLGKDPAKAAAKRLLEAGIPVLGTLPDGTAVALASDDVDEKSATVYAVRSIPPEVTFTNELRDLLTHVELQNIQAVGHQQADALVDTLKDREDVEILNLVDSDLTDAGLRSLQRLTGLRLVSLNGTKVTAEGIAAFHRAVPGCHLNTDAGDVPVDYMAIPNPPVTAP